MAVWLFLWFFSAVFIHDPRIKCAEASRVSMAGKSISVPEHSGKDFWWPEMEAHLTFSKTDSRGRPDVEQHYLIPNSYTTHNSFAERGVYSMWSHFCGYCSGDPEFLENRPTNAIIDTPRLPIFLELTEGEAHVPAPPSFSVSWSDYISATLRKDSVSSIESDDESFASLAPGEQSPSTVAVNTDALLWKHAGRKTPRAVDLLRGVADISDFGLA